MVPLCYDSTRDPVASLVFEYSVAHIPSACFVAAIGHDSHPRSTQVLPHPSPQHLVPTLPIVSNIFLYKKSVIRSNSLSSSVTLHLTSYPAGQPQKLFRLACHGRLCCRSGHEPRHFNLHRVCFRPLDLPMYSLAHRLL